MKSAVLIEANNFIIEDLPIPHPKDNQVLVRNKVCAICNSTDTKFKTGKHDLSKFPCIIGHEGVGVVEAIGKNVNNVKIGDVVLGGMYPESWSATNNFNVSSPVYSGNRSASTVLGGWGGFSLHKDSGSVSTSSYSKFVFYVHGGTAGGQNLRVTLQDNSQEYTTVYVNDYIEGGSIAAGKWRRVEIPLSALGASNIQLTRINIKNASGSTIPILYIDRIRLE